MMLSKSYLPRRSDWKDGFCLQIPISQPTISTTQQPTWWFQDLLKKYKWTYMSIFLTILPEFNAWKSPRNINNSPKERPWIGSSRHVKHHLAVLAGGGSAISWRQWHMSSTCELGAMQMEEAYFSMLMNWCRISSTIWLCTDMYI